MLYETAREPPTAYKWLPYDEPTKRRYRYFKVVREKRLENGWEKTTTDKYGLVIPGRSLARK